VCGVVGCARYVGPPCRAEGNVSGADGGCEAGSPTGDRNGGVCGRLLLGRPRRFQHLKGVTSAISGYSGGTVENPYYELVSSGSTGHAESVQITYDSSQITYGKLLMIFFSLAHDPTQKERQGPDIGTQ